MKREHYENGGARQLALGLGWFSIALGTAELLTPNGVARLIGVNPTDGTRATLRTYGAREIANGLAILAQPEEARWLWARVGGDALDLSTLGAAMGSEHTDQGRAVGAAVAVAGVAALDVMCAQALSRNGAASPSAEEGYRVVQATTINRGIDDVYGFWRSFQNLPRFMRHLESVEVIDDRRSRWRAKGPAGLKVEWEAEMIEDRPNELISWRSLPGSQVENRGSVHFQTAPGARGTEVRVELEYRPPAGGIGRNVAWLFGEEPAQQIHEDLRRFKQLMETGEIALSDGPGLWRPARPAADPERLRSIAGVHS
jgi:uncharacterized membrane protein